MGWRYRSLQRLDYPTYSERIWDQVKQRSRGLELGLPPTSFYCGNSTVPARTLLSASQFHYYMDLWLYCSTNGPVDRECHHRPRSLWWSQDGRPMLVHHVRWPGPIDMNLDCTSSLLLSSSTVMFCCISPLFDKGGGGKTAQAGPGSGGEQWWEQHWETVALRRIEEDPLALTSTRLSSLVRASPTGVHPPGRGTREAHLRLVTLSFCPLPSIHFSYTPLVRTHWQLATGTMSKWQRTLFVLQGMYIYTLLRLSLSPATAQCHVELAFRWLAQCRRPGLDRRHTYRARKYLYPTDESPPPTTMPRRSCCLPSHHHRSP